MKDEECGRLRRGEGDDLKGGRKHLDLVYLLV